ncbi:Gx transporter family protein [Eubacterium oxidoreducens]|uniref:Heptaprenyl diphosphate synthase n=1 Tax=Eubacterium oxidoreducens TaxID=1732 RepID=A0A1G6AMR9_EUBOX|nr:Gx transporter family protein [Eubacterium oxidoreducens]SDB09706.1 heptaprenyl diphosphate synthase [Eubacterium oxidoreducens]
MKHNVAFLGVFLALALVFSYVEAMIPFAIAIPGVKLGITNIVIVLILYLNGPKEALIVSVLRVILAGLLFGNLFSILYSMAGALLSLAIMVFIRHTKQFHVITVSAIGGIVHNLGQLIVAAFVVENYNIMYYFAVLMIAGVVTGIIIGIVGNEMIKRVGHLFWKRQVRT